MPTATDEPLEESAGQDGAAAADSPNGAAAAESPNGVHDDHDVTVAAGYEDDPGAEPEAAAEVPAASVFSPDPGPDAPAAEPTAGAFDHDTSMPTAPHSMFADEGPPLPAAVGFSAGAESPAPADEPSSSYQAGPAYEPSSFYQDGPTDEPRSSYQAGPTDEPPSSYQAGTATAYGSQPGYGYTAGYGYAPEYAAETGYNQGMTQPVGQEAAAAPTPAYPADLPASPARSGGAKSTLAGAYRSLPRPKPRTRVRGELVPARRANLVIARLEPWSVMKFSFLMSLVAWVVLFVAVALLYYALSSLGVFESIQRTLASVTSSTSSGGVNLTKWTSAPRVLGYTMLIGAVDVVLITALATIGAMVYNLVTHLGGGIESILIISHQERGRKGEIAHQIDRE